MIPYGIPLIYSTVACDAAPSVRLFLLPLSPPSWGSLQTKEAQHDNEDSQQKRSRAVHRQRKLVSARDQPERSLHRRRAARCRAWWSVLASGRNRDHSAVQQGRCRRRISSSGSSPYVPTRPLRLRATMATATSCSPSRSSTRIFRWMNSHCTLPTE